MSVNEDAKRLVRPAHVVPLLLAGWLLSPGGVARAQRASDGPAAVMDRGSRWRTHHTLKPPVFADGKPCYGGPAWLTHETAEPPTGWQEPNFDDGSWARGPLTAAVESPYIARLCLRGRFGVTRPGAFSLVVEYHGGVIVYVNGKEIGRAHLTGGGLAQAYSDEAFITEDRTILVRRGDYDGVGSQRQSVSAESQRRMKLRTRRYEVAIPAGALRRGVNVLAVEVMRAPYASVLKDESLYRGRGKLGRAACTWSTCEIVDVRLTGAGAAANTSRPQGLQVWNADLLAGDFDTDFGDRNEPLRPVGIIAARNGLASGKVLVGSDKAIEALTATAGNLTGPGGAIPASAVQVRYGLPWGRQQGGWGTLLGAVVEQAPKQIPVGARGQGAVAAVWVTVKVPKTARAGTYTGALRIQARGHKPIAVPLRLEVADWTLPDPDQYRTWVELIEVPDTLAVEYSLPLWSDRHFEMIADAFRFISDTGTRVVYVPLIAHTNLGNAESMVRWIDKGGGRYEFDFSVMDRYLDTAVKHLGKPKIVVLQAWEIYMSSRDSVGKRFGGGLARRHQVSDGGPLVTVLDPATGKTENRALPRLSEPASRPLWQALLRQVRANLGKRGLGDAVMLGMFTDAVPPKEDVQFFKAIAPDLPWVQQGHGLWTKKLHGIAEIGYQASVWGGYRFGDGLRQTNQRGEPVMKSLYGWKRPRLDAVFERNTGLDTFPCTRWYFFAETGVTSELRGIGRIGADYWRAVKDPRGRRAGWVHGRFPEGAWAEGGSMNLNLCNPVLAPGPNGPAATNRLIAMIEGVQAAEARIAIERALTDPRLRARLGPFLAGRCQAALDERLVSMWKSLSNHLLRAGGFNATAWRWRAGVAGHRWFLGSGWQDRTGELNSLAGEVQRALAGR